MATSGSVDFNQTRTEIIEDALDLIGVKGAGRTVSSEDMTFCVRALQRMIKSWQTKGLHLWAKEEGILFLADNTADYTLSNAASAARVTSKDDAAVTELSSAGSASDTVLTVDSTTNMTASDIVGIVLDDDTVDWTTIVSVDSTTQITITAGLSSASAIDNKVYAFTSRINKPLRISSVRRVEGLDSGATSTRTEIPMIALSHSEYQNLPNKTLNGLPSHYYYNPDNTDGQISIWPRPDDPNVYLEFTYSRMLEDMDAVGNNLDMPVEWLEAVVYQLAVRIAPRFGKEQKVLALIQPMATDLLHQLLDWDAEVENITIRPDLGY